MEELKEMCRVCMAEAEDLLDIYDKTKTCADDRLSQALKRTDEPEPSLSDLLKECSPICVEPDDPFPKKVCDPCLRKVRDAVFFHRRYAKTMEYIDRVKVEKHDQDIINDLEQEEWDLQIGQENKDDDENDKDDDKDDEDDEDEPFKDEEDEDDDYEEDESDDSEDNEDEYLPVRKKRRTDSFSCPVCPKTFVTEAQLTIHSDDHSKDSNKQNGTNTRPKRRSAKY